MRPTLLLPLSLAASIAISVGGCAKQEPTSAVATATSPGASAAPATSGAPGTSAPKGGPNAEFITKADAICTAFNAQVANVAEPTSDEEFVEYHRSLLPDVKQQVADIEALGEPPEMVQVWDRAFGAQRKFADRLEELLDSPDITADVLLNDSELDAFQKEGKAGAAEFGLQVCGRGSSSGSGSGSGSGSANGSTSTTRSRGGLGGLGGNTGSGSSGRSSTTSTTEADPGDNSSGDGSGSVFDADTCLQISSAYLDLILATTTPAAQTAAQQLLALTPPTEVKMAIEVLVDGPGIQFADKGKTQSAADTVSGWQDSVCG